MGQSQILVENKLEILGTVFSCDGKYNEHINSRIRKCRNSYYSLTKCGMAYPGATTDVKTYLWKSVCSPVLMYGTDGVSVGKNNVKQLDTAQGNLLKQAMGLSKRAHSTELLVALGIRRSRDVLNRNIVSLYSRIFNVSTPLLDLTSQFLSMYIVSNVVIPGTIVSDVLSMGISPLSYAFNKPPKININIHDNGHIDSIRNLIYHENFLKPYSDEHTLVNLLTKSF